MEKANSSRWIISCSLLFGGLVYACLPANVVPIDDDFGYLRSVIKTIQHRRPWTDDWLEPWAASLSSTSALLYVVFGNFYFATYGLLAALAATSFYFCAKLLERRTSLWFSLVTTTIALTFPTIFWKEIQFTGMAIYIPCLFGGLWAYDQKRWAQFLLFWSIAIGSRQSAITWIALPLFATFTATRTNRAHYADKAVWLPAVTAGAGAALFGLLALGMNKTHAQTVITDHLLDKFSLGSSAMICAIGVGIILVMAGLGTLFSTLSSSEATRSIHFRQPVVRVILALLVVVVLAVDPRWRLLWEHTILSGTIGLLYLRTVAILGLLGWMIQGTPRRIELVACAAASLALLSIRGQPWDYYFFDVGAFALFSFEPENAFVDHL